MRPQSEPPLPHLAVSWCYNRSLPSLEPRLPLPWLGFRPHRRAAGSFTTDISEALSASWLPVLGNAMVVQLECGDRMSQCGMAGLRFVLRFRRWSPRTFLFNISVQHHRSGKLVFPLEFKSSYVVMTCWTPWTNVLGCETWSFCFCGAEKCLAINLPAMWLVYVFNRKKLTDRCDCAVYDDVYQEEVWYV